MKKLFILFINLVAVVCVAQAQQSAPKLPRQCEAFLPKILLDAEVLKESDANKLLQDPSWGQNVDPGDGRRKYWIAYSDRADNPTYYTSSSGQQFKQLRLSERVIISKIENNYALVYREPQYGREYPSISKDAECMGWVPMSKLLLWSSCLANDHGIYNKALLCLNLDQTQLRKNELGVGYTNPDKQNEDAKYRVRLKTDMDFYFIMKRLNDGRVLLAQQNKLTGLSSDVLSFWVDESSYIAWSQRSCIEPTWDAEDVEYFSGNQISAQIYEDSRRSNVVSRVNYERKSGAEPDRYRMMASSLRYPLLDGGTDNLYKCSVFSALGGEAVNDYSKRQGENVAQQIQSINKLRNIKMAIVIDGTSSMEKFYPAVKRAISNACNYFAENQYSIKISVVIYRDYADGDKGLVEMCTWSDADDPRINEFLDKGGEYGIRSAASDRTSAEALYYGINYAVENLGFDENESNIILVVGDCGNDEEDTQSPVTGEQLTKKLIDNKIHFLSFQVRYLLNNTDFANYNDQMCAILKDNLEARFNALRKGEKVKFTPNQEGFTFTNDFSDLLVGEHKFNASGGEVAPQILTDLMVNSIRFCATAINAQISAMTRGYSADLSIFDSTDKELQRLEIDNAFIAERLGQEYVDNVKYLNSLMTFAGYTPKKDSSGRSFYKPVVFISRDELNDLMNRLSPVDEAARRRVNDREPYLRAMKALVRSMIPDISEEQMAQMGNQEIMNLANGLNESSDALKGYTLSDMADVTKVDDRKYQQILDRFQDKYRKLKGIQQTRYKFAYDFNGSQYYWIPIEDLP